MNSSCHADRKVYAKSLCRSCYEKDLRRRNPEYAERQRENQRGWVKANPERKRLLDSRYSTKPEAQLKSVLKNYGLTITNYEELLVKQRSKCAICGTIPKRRLDVDHDHATGIVRGLLCNRCNRGLGWFKEQSNLLGLAAAYLIDTPRQQISEEVFA